MNLFGILFILYFFKLLCGSRLQRLRLDNDGFLKEKLKDVPKVYDFIFQELLVAKR